MLQVLLWQDRFDLDGKQIIARRLRSLLENNRMPLRDVHRVLYYGEHAPDSARANQLSIQLEEHKWPVEVELQISEFSHKFTNTTFLKLEDALAF
ncbi:hypothetical protein AAVH_32519 [Aphelenchoides avenae]|nr:hypothetical protein AAVH_32519 [Aphelenchus avenae]